MSVTIIEQPSDLCTVIVTVDADPTLMPDLEVHARDGLTRFAELDGFVSGALHKSEDGGRLVQYLQWKTKADHLACMNDARWDKIPSTQRFMDLVNSGQAKIDVRTYHVVSGV